MNFQEKKRYRYPVETLLKVFSDKDYFLEKYARAGATRISVLEDVQTDAGSRVTISRDVQVDVPVTEAGYHYPDSVRQLGLCQPHRPDRDSVSGDAGGD